MRRKKTISRRRFNSTNKPTHKNNVVKVIWDDEDKDVKFDFPENFKFQPRLVSKEEVYKNGGKFHTALV